MTFSAKVNRLDILEAKLAQLPASLQENMYNSNDQNADEFMAQVLRIIPLHTGELASTLVKGPSDKPRGVKVTIGGPAAPYPLFVEKGHFTKSGVFVHAEPFWWPTWRVLKRRFRSRNARHFNTALKKVANGQS